MTSRDHLGTALLIGVLGVVYGLALTVLQATERATGGWGDGLHFFRVPWAALAVVLGLGGLATIRRVTI